MICDSCGTLEALESLPIRHKTSQERKRASVYRDMRECRLALLEAFPYSFINERNEFIAHKKSNQYFCLENCEYPEDIDCKVLEWLSRAACKGMPYKAEWRNRKFRQFMLDGINKYLETDFSEEDMYQIYTYLGNACHHARTVKFVESGFEMGVMQ
jgi:hypothetical protein